MPDGAGRTGESGPGPSLKHGSHRGAGSLSSRFPEAAPFRPGQGDFATSRAHHSPSAEHGQVRAPIPPDCAPFYVQRASPPRDGGTLLASATNDDETFHWLAAEIAVARRMAHDKEKSGPGASRVRRPCGDVASNDIVAPCPSPRVQHGFTVGDRFAGTEVVAV